MSGDFPQGRRGVSVLIFSILFLALFAGMAPNVSSRLVAVGEGLWPGYAKDLRQDPVEPECELEQLEAEVALCPPDGGAAPAGEQISGDPFAEEAPDPFAEETPDPFAEEAPDPFAEEAPDPFAEETPDPFAEEAPDPFAEEAPDPFAEEAPDPFAEEAPDPFAATAEPTKKVPSNCAALRSLTDRCGLRHSSYQTIQAKITPSVDRFRSIEKVLSSLAKFPYWKHMLALLALLGAFCATAKREHIALRLPRNPTEHRLSQLMQLAAHLFWLVSCLEDYGIQKASTASAETIGLPLVWAAGFGILGCMNLWHLLRSTPEREVEPTVLRLVMVVPLYAYMGVLGGAYFILGEGHGSGQAIYLHKFTQIPNIYLGIGLYIWSGMLFSTTRIAKLFFRTLLPWGLPISLLAWVTVALAAIPTAYSGASGIFVIAAGSVIFKQLTEAGATKRLALAATAMSGSFGVVLQPCLVVVLVAVLNKQVTTDVLFAKGLWVFGLAISVLLVALLLRSKEPLRFNPLKEAIPGTARAFIPLLPYMGLGLAVLLLYGLGLKTWLNEHTAAFMLPGILLVLVLYERKSVLPKLPEEPDQRALWPTLVGATTEASSHIGALLMLMAASVGLGGVVERAELMNFFPSDFGSPAIAMTALVFIMVIVGMLMDALGAVVLVSVTLASVAYDNGIDPVHFWMMVLSAFELGYLTPPVAINHLLARQVIGDEARVEEDEVEGFWNRTEHIWLPVAVRGAVLVIVAYVPFLWYGS
jgi:TRAP-type C4-dicarboxylate transport system permease large subunit